MNDLYLVSYPRSGNTWIRYILAFFSKCPVLDKKKWCPSMSVDIGVDRDAKYIAKKSHTFVGVPLNSKIILIIRSYKESIVRHAKHTFTKEKFIKSTTGEVGGIDYMRLIKAFDGFNGEKLIIYYEDLIEKPEEEIEKILNFSNIDKQYWDEFFDNYEFHKNNSISTYSSKSYTKGNSINYHSKDLSEDMVNFMTNHLKKNFPKLFDKYLKRYE